MPATISGLGTDFTMSLVGAGSMLPDTRVDNATLLDRIRPARPDGRPIEPEWVVRHLGIVERRMDIDFPAARKRSRADGGIYDGDLAVGAGRRALDDAGVPGADIDVLVHVSTTPDTIACGDHLRFITRELGLRADVELVHHNMGCAGLAAGFRTAAAYLRSMAPATALVVASNSMSAYYGAENAAAYHEDRHPGTVMDWLVPMIFADGGGATVWRGAPAEAGGAGPGLRSVRYETDPDTELITYPAGGGLHHTTSANVGDHRFFMDGRRVNDEYVPSLRRALAMLEEDWPAHVKPTVGGEFDPLAVDRWYLHQGNGVIVRQVIDELGLPAERVPIGVDRYGNISAAGTLVLLDEDRRAGLLRPGDLAVFLWVGAGNGAMTGYAALVA